MPAIEENISRQTKETVWFVLSFGENGAYFCTSLLYCDILQTNGALFYFHICVFMKNLLFSQVLPKNKCFSAMLLLDNDLSIILKPIYDYHIANV